MLEGCWEGGKSAFEVRICVKMKELWAFWEKKMFRKLIYTQGSGIESFKWIGCTKCTIYMVSLVIK